MTKNESKMKLWRCPKCSHEVKAIAISVGHRCPSNKRLDTAYQMIEGEK